MQARRWRYWVGTTKLAEVDIVVDIVEYSADVLVSMLLWERWRFVFRVMMDDQRKLLFRISAFSLVFA